MIFENCFPWYPQLFSADHRKASVLPLPQPLLLPLLQVVNERLSTNCKARLTVENDDRGSLYSGGCPPLHCLCVCNNWEPVAEGVSTC